MSKRIEKRVREEAAMLCSVVANSDWPGSPCNCLMCVSSVLGVSDEVYLLAMRARDAIPDTGFYELRFAEAEALLRTGWTPT